jgi:APA family basic amino acid/polyamine antiporter
VVSGVGGICIAFSLGILTRVGGGDGIQAQIERAFGAPVGFLVTWSFWCSNVAASAALAIAVGSAVSWIDPGLAGVWAVVAIGVASVVALAFVNALGARTSGKMQIATVAIKILPLIAVVVIALLRARSHHFEPLATTPLTISNIASAVALTLFALTGFENATAPVDKIRDASRTLPMALVGGTLFVAILYLLSSTSVLLLLPAKVVASSPAPFADAISAAWGNGAATLIAAAVAVSAFGALNGMILAMGELAYSLALRGDLPRTFTGTSATNAPIAAQLLGAALTVLLILANSTRATASLFTFALLLSTASVLVLYLVGALAAWRHSRPRERPIIIVAVGFSIFALWGAGFEADVWGIVLLVVGYAIRMAMRALNSRATILPSEAAPAAPRE